MLKGLTTVFVIALLSLSWYLGHLRFLQEAFVAKPQAEHLKKICPAVHIEVFPKLNHGQLLVDHPEEIARRIGEITDV